MFSVANNRAYINGLQGKYDTTIKNPSTRYGRNAISNHIDYLKSYGFEPVECDIKEQREVIKKHPTTEEEWEEYFRAIDTTLEKTAKFTADLDKQIKNLTPVNFELQYMPDCKKGKVDKDALLGASYEEMGKRYSVSVNEMNRQLNPLRKGQDAVTADSMDINKDKRIDIAEYATSILLTDMLSTDGENLSVKNIDGKITNQGENRLLNGYYNTKNKDTYSNIYTYLYHYFNLGQAKREFIQNPDNFSNDDRFLIQ